MRAGAKVLYKWRLVCCKLSANVLMLTEKSVKSVVYLCDHFNHRAAALVLSILVQLVVFEGLPWNNFGCRTDLVAVLHTNRSQYDTWWPVSVVNGNVRQGHCTAIFKAHDFCRASDTSDPFQQKWFDNRSVPSREAIDYCQAVQVFAER